MLIKILDSKTKQYIQAQANNINIYSCGVTPYKQTHIGNLRSAILANIIQNIYIQYGYQCTHISNITDIGWSENSQQANQYMETFHKNYMLSMYIHWKEYIKALVLVVNNIPEVYPASNFITHNIEHIKKIENNICVTKDDEGIYINTEKCNINKDELINKGSRLSSFAIWKNKTDGVFKQQGFEGIPGWHIECFSIINSIAKTQENGYKVEIHIGGIDLMDIHHNCEIIHHYLEHKNYKLARIWLHTNLLLINGSKMSKRLNNTITLEQILEKINIPTFMIIMLSTQYKKTININDANIKQATNRYKRIVKNFIKELIKFKNIENSYKLLNTIENIIKNTKDHLYENNILDITLLTNNLNTPCSIMFLQTIKIKSMQNIYDFYVIDKVLNTQILQTIHRSLTINIDKQYLYSKKQQMKQQESLINTTQINTKLNINSIYIKVNNIEIII